MAKKEKEGGGKSPVRIKLTRDDNDAWPKREGKKKRKRSGGGGEERSSEENPSLEDFTATTHWHVSTAPTAATNDEVLTTDNNANVTSKAIPGVITPIRHKGKKVLKCGLCPMMVCEKNKQSLFEHIFEYHALF